MPLLDLTCTTELQAVNVLLQSIGETEVQSLEEPRDVDTTSALSHLNNANRQIQSMGWHFNTDRERLFTLSVPDSFILIPTNALRVDTVGQSAHMNVRHEGVKLWDIDNNTYVFEDDLYLDIVLLKDFETIPQPARDYITAVAGMKFQASSVGSEALYKFTQADVNEARLILRRADNSNSDANILNDNWHCARFKQGRRPILF